MGSSNKFLHKIAKQRALAESYKTDESGKAWPSVEAYIEKLKSKGIPLLDNVTVLVNVNGTVQEMTNKGQSDISSFIQKVADETNGQDGVSPSVTVSTIQGGHQVTITDAEHPQGQSFNVMDGEDAQTGTPVSLTFTYEDDSTQTYSFLTAPSNNS